ncbi:hypothetical protein E4T45_10226 [Aureobasidium sp. EXF-8846]|nr:hypothetical protein E4T45_10226 [Aureobasidium sp. EXF-8846]
MHRREIMGFTKAYFVFTAQSRMMAFLRRFVSGLLAEANEAPIYTLNPKWSQLINTDFSRFGSTSSWSTDSLKPFSAPPSFDPQKIMELIASRHRAVKDEVELLQTDPAYIQFHARELASAHFFETFSGSDRWPYFVDQLFCIPLRREMYWRQLNNEIRRMGERLQDIEDAPSDTEARAGYEHMVHLVWDLCLETSAVFENGVKTSLLYQRGFERKLDICGDGRRDKFNRTFTIEDHFPNDMLYWAVSSLGHDKYRPLSMDPSLNFAIIDYLCRTDRKEAARISQGLLVQISDMAVLFDILGSINLRSIRDVQITQEYYDKHQEKNREQFLKKMNAPFGDNEIGDKLGEFLERACTQYPWPRGRKSQEWLQETDAAQDALNVSWSEMRLIWARKLQESQVAERYIKEDIDEFMRFSEGEKHLKVLTAQREAMFPENGGDSSRSFTWQHFLAAMTDAGFNILQSQGSAVTFKLEKSQGVNTIVVHRPHPVATINPIMLRSIGKRITKWFGWHRETFVEVLIKRRTSHASTSPPPRSSSVQGLEYVRDYRPSTTENTQVPAEKTRTPAEDTENLPDPSPVH